MIYELPSGDYQRVKPLFSEMAHHLAIDAIIAGDTPAMIYVDDPLEPQVGLILPWNAYRIYLAGAADCTAFNHAAALLLDERYSQFVNSAYGAEFVVYNAPGAWDASIDALLPNAKTSRFGCQYWRLEPSHFAARALLPAGMLVRSVDAKLLGEGLLQTNDLIDEMHSESHSVEDFLQHKFGSCVQVDDALAAWCLSEYNRPGRCELGIETLEPYRRRGLAVATASATIERAWEEGITEIGWHCWANNAGSIAVATRLGFEKGQDYAVWYCRQEPSGKG